MRIFRVLTPLLGLLGAFLLAPASHLSAQTSSNDFFERDSALNVFGDAIVEKQVVTYQHLPPAQFKKVDVVSDTPEKLVPPPAQEPAQKSEKAKDLGSKEAIIAEYGNPSEPAPILAQENAPKPFKAMMAALQAKDDQLAYQYARQWIRYMDDLNARTTKVMDVTRVAQQVERAMPGESPEVKQLRERVALENLPQPDAQSAELDPRAQALLDRARAESRSAAPRQQTAALNTGNQEEQREIAARREIRQQLGGKIPVDAKGKVEIYIFFDPADPKLKEAGAHAVKLFNLTQGRRGINLVGYTSVRQDPRQLAQLKKQLKLPFAVLSGDTFSRELQLSRYPAVVLVAPSSGRVVKETLEKPIFYFDELIAMIQGRAV